MGSDTAGLGGIVSVTYRVDGLLRLIEDGVRLEWTQTQTTEQVSFERIGTDVKRLPTEWLELPVERIASARVAGGWWRSRLELRARDADDFDGMPEARGITLPLRIELLDRALARSVAKEIQARVAAVAPASKSYPRPGSADSEG